MVLRGKQALEHVAYEEKLLLSNARTSAVFFCDRTASLGAVDLPPSPVCYNSKSSGSAALLALSWTCLLVRTVFPTPDKRQGETWKKLVCSIWFAEVSPWR